MDTTITFILSLPICFSLLWLLKNYAKQVVYASLPYFILFPIFFDVYLFVTCTINSSCSEAFPLVYRILLMIFVLLVVGVIVWIFVANWHPIELTINIIGVFSNAILRNLGLLGGFAIVDIRIGWLEEGNLIPWIFWQSMRWLADTVMVKTSWADFTASSASLGGGGDTGR